MLEAGNRVETWSARTEHAHALLRSQKD